MKKTSYLATIFTLLITSIMSSVTHAEFTTKIKPVKINIDVYASISLSGAIEMELYPDSSGWRFDEISRTGLTSPSITVSANSNVWIKVDSTGFRSATNVPAPLLDDMVAYFISYPKVTLNGLNLEYVDQEIAPKGEGYIFIPLSRLKTPFTFKWKVAQHVIPFDFDGRWQEVSSGTNTDTITFTVCDGADAAPDKIITVE